MAKTYQDIYSEIESLLLDNSSGLISEADVRQVAHDILDFANPSDTSAASLGIEWNSAITYNTDDLVTYLDRIWKSKIDTNLNNEPPTDPAITEDANWIEQSRSESSPIKEWEAGVYGAGLVIVFYDNHIYKLTVGTRPYTSSDIATEISAGNWTEIPIDKADLVGGKIPSSQLPSYVDDVEEYADYASLPVAGESDKIYITLDNNRQYRWSGSAYISISVGPAGTDGQIQYRVDANTFGGKDSSDIIEPAIEQSDYDDFKLIGMQRGVWEDIGNTWENLGHVTPTPDITNCAYLGNGIAIICYSQGGNGIWRTTDYGKTWTDTGFSIAGLTHAYGLAYIGNGICLAGFGDSGYLARSVDYGKTWVSLGQYGTLSRIYDFVYLGNGIVLAAGGSSTANTAVVLRSTDYGATWSTAYTPGTSRWIFSFAYCGNGIVIAGDGTTNGTIHRSTDYGVTWTPITNLYGTIWKMRHLGGGILIAGVGGSEAIIYRSIDYGLTWTLVADFSSTSSDLLVIEYCGQGVCLAGSYGVNPGGEIYKSIDYGKTWINKGQLVGTETWVMMLCYLEKGIVMAGLANNGLLMRSTLPSIKPNAPVTLTDGAAITSDWEDADEKQFALDSAETAIAMTVLNVKEDADTWAAALYSIRKQSTSDLAITFSGTGLKFVDLNNKAAPNASVVITLINTTANMFFTIGAWVSGLDDSGDIIIYLNAY